MLTTGRLSPGRCPIVLLLRLFRTSSEIIRWYIECSKPRSTFAYLQNHTVKMQGDRPVCMGEQHAIKSQKTLAGQVTSTPDAFHDLWDQLPMAPMTTSSSSSCTFWLSWSQSTKRQHLAVRLKLLAPCPS